MHKYSGQLKNYQYDIRVKKSHKGKNSKYYKEDEYFNESIMTFDIETTSAWLEDGKVIGYSKGYSSDYWNELYPLALCYIWQFSVDGKVYYGRELKDFIEVLKDLPDNAKSIIWVHNLAFEFGFLSGILEWDTAFARSPHKPMKCIAKGFPNIEFRCTYMLTRLSLESWGKQLGLPKRVGDLDYDVLRTPLTQLTYREQGYCERDCEVVEKGIQYYKNKYKSIHKIPLTQTGIVRREVKDLLMKDEDYRKFIKTLVPRSTTEYKLFQKVFAGGYTHANRLHSGHVIDERVQHYDFASSYPTVMVCEKYPMTPFKKLNKKSIPPSYMFERKAYIIELSFTNIKSTSFNTYLQACKCECTNAYLDNGRIISADTLTTTITEQDYITISNNYVWDDVQIISLWESNKDYLPKKFIEFILQLYENKTTLKDVEGQEDLYLQAKQFINSLFGMCVTAIVQAEVRLLDTGEWKMMPLTDDYVSNRLDRLRKQNDNSYFLSYAWGCWVTAYSRRNLWTCIESVDGDVIYCDTDSIFVIGEQDFSWYNEQVTNKLKRACDTLHLDFSKTRPKTIKGKEKPLGVFDREDDCIEFITLGAKRYCERREDNKLYLTISGINKGAVDMLQNDIYNFKDGFNFDKDDPSVHKKLLTYCTDIPTVQYPDGYISSYTHGINLRNNGYLLTVTDEYKRLIDYGDEVVEINDNFYNKMRGGFLTNAEKETLLQHI